MAFKASIREAIIVSSRLLRGVPSPPAHHRRRVWEDQGEPTRGRGLEDRRFAFAVSGPSAARESSGKGEQPGQEATGASGRAGGVRAIEAQMAGLERANAELTTALQP